jgi:SAM-dependent methyltransferase
VTDLPHPDPTDRFAGLAELYARCRPDYPEAAVAHVLARCGLGPGAVVIDVGCGTGISARTFGRRGLCVLGVEPNADMRRQAEAEPGDGPPAPVYRDGTAEATGLPDGCADAVLAAQAFHWFEPGPTLREFHRVLKPAGWAALLWNERDESDPFTAAYGAVVGASRQARQVEAGRWRSGEALLRSPLFEDGRLDEFRHRQPLTEEGILGRAFSASYAPREPAEAGRHAAALREVFARFEQGGEVVLCYRTFVYTARRAARLPEGASQ